MEAYGVVLLDRFFDQVPVRAEGGVGISFEVGLAFLQAVDSALVVTTCDNCKVCKFLMAIVGQVL